MSHVARLFLFAVGALLSVGTARAASPWYISGSAGAYFRENQSGPTTFHQGAASGPGNQDETFDPGGVFSLALGHRLSSRFRIEGEIGYAHYQPAKVNPVSGTFPPLNGSDFTLQSGGDQNRYLVTLNAFYDLPVEGRFVPYIGLGVGFAHQDTARATFVNASGGRFLMAGQSADHGVGLVEAGLTIAISGSWALVPAYRYVHFFGNANRFGDETAHIVKMGVRYSF